MDIKQNTFPEAQASQQPWPFDRRPINGKYLFKMVGGTVGGLGGGEWLKCWPHQSGKMANGGSGSWLVIL